jgi:hypothetical protein
VSDEDVARLRRQAQGVIGAGQQELPLPLAPEPTHPGVALPRAAAVKLDDPATVPVPLVEDDTVTRTPPPLPPSPASAAAEVWLEDAVTRPSALSDFAPSMAGQTVPGLHSSGSHRVELDPLAALRDAHAREMRAMRRLTILASATSMAVGLALAALVLRGCG